MVAARVDPSGVLGEYVSAVVRQACAITGYRGDVRAKVARGTWPDKGPGSGPRVGHVCKTKLATRTRRLVIAALDASVGASESPDHVVIDPILGRERGKVGQRLSTPVLGELLNSDHSTVIWQRQRYAVDQGEVIDLLGAVGLMWRRRMVLLRGPAAAPPAAWEQRKVRGEGVRMRWHGRMMRRRRANTRRR